MYQETYHLYHHQPYPLDRAMIRDEAWLVNNGVNYSIVATMKASTAEKAYEGFLAKMEDHSQRSVEVRVGNILRKTLPGDVLVGAENAWMLLPDGHLHVLPYEPSAPWKFYAHDSAVGCLSWNPTGEHLVAASNHVLLHTLSGREERRYSATSYRRHGNHTVYAVAWSPDGTRIASGGYDAEVHIWKPHPEGGYGEAAHGSLVICRTQEINKSYDRRITCLTWALDSHTFLAGRSNGDIIQWDATTGECLHICQRHQGDVTALAYSPDGTRIASASSDGTLRLWVSEHPDQEVVCQHAGKVPSFAWAPDSSLIVSACQGEQSLQFWDAVSGMPCERLPLSVFSTKHLTIQAIAWSPDGRFLAVGCDDGTLQMIEIVLRRHIQTYRAAHAQINCVAWSPDGCSLACGEGNHDGVQIWRIGMNTHQKEDVEV